LFQRHGLIVLGSHFGNETATKITRKGCYFISLNLPGQRLSLTRALELLIATGG